MSISKKLFLISLMVTGSFYAESASKNSSTHHHHISNRTIYTKPSNTEKTIINRFATDQEIKLADATAAQALVNINKPMFQVIGENIHDNMQYLYNAQPFGVEHGLVKGAGIAVALIGLAYLHKLYADYCFHQSKEFKSKRSE